MGTSKVQFKTIDEYMNSFPKEIRNILQTLRQTIKEEAPEAVETISYQIPTFKQNGKPLIYFAAFKSHISLYPITSKMEQSIAELSNYKRGKGTLQFPIEQPLPLPLIRQVIQFIVKEN